jgi:hypothetical protein
MSKTFDLNDQNYEFKKYQLVCCFSNISGFFFLSSSNWAKSLGIIFSSISNARSRLRSSVGRSASLYGNFKIFVGFSGIGVLPSIKQSLFFWLPRFNILDPLHKLFLGKRLGMFHSLLKFFFAHRKWGGNGLLLGVRHIRGIAKITYKFKSCFKTTKTHFQGIDTRGGGDEQKGGCDGVNRLFLFIRKRLHFAHCFLTGNFWSFLFSYLNGIRIAPFKRIKDMLFHAPWIYFSSFWRRIASFINRSPSSLEMGLAMLNNDFHTLSLSSVVFAWAKGLRSFALLFIGQIYKNPPIRYNRNVLFRLHRLLSPEGFLFLDFQYWKQSAEFAFWNYSHKQWYSNLSGGSHPLGITDAWDFPTRTRFQIGLFHPGNHLLFDLNLKNLYPLPTCFNHNEKPEENQSLRGNPRSKKNPQTTYNIYFQFPSISFANTISKIQLTLQMVNYEINP